MNESQNSKGILKGTIWNTLGSTMYGVNSFVMLALVSRIGTVEQAGYFGIAFTTAQLLYIVGLFGVNNYQMTDYHEKYQFSDYAKVKLFSCLLMIIGCIAFIVLLRFRGEKFLYLCTLTVLMMLNAIGELYQALFFQKNRLDLSGSALFFRTFWSLVLFIAVLLISHNVFIALVVQILMNLMITVYYAVKVSPKFRGDKKAGTECSNAKMLVEECIPLFISMFLMNIIINASKYGIEILSTDTVQGYFNMIFMPAQVVNLCSQFIFKPLLSRYSELLSEQRYKEFLKLLFRQILMVVVFTGICGVAAYVLGVEVLGFFYKKDISVLRVPLMLVIFGGGIFAVCQLFYYIFIILRWQKYIFVIYVLAVAFSFCITAFFVLEMSIMGAVIAFGVTHIFILLCYLFVFLRFLRRKIHA